MRAIEFTVKIKNGIIQIPEKYRKSTDQLARVIILTDENDSVKPLQDIHGIQSILDKLRARKVFSEIKDPTTWQSSIREEWNERTD